MYNNTLSNMSSLVEHVFFNLFKFRLLQIHQKLEKAQSTLTQQQVSSAPGFHASLLAAADKGK